MLDYLGIFRELNTKRIRYVLVGGLAVNLHGIPRMTYDIDLLLDLEDRNVEQFIQLIASWGFKPKIPVAIADFADAEKRRDWIENKNMKAFNLVNEAWAIRGIDILIQAPVDFAKADEGKKVVVIQGVSIPIVGLDDLIRMKEHTDRRQDEADVRSLKELYDE